MIKDILCNTNCQKILDFLLHHPNEEFYDREISQLTNVSRAGTNFALRDLVKARLAQRQRRGRMYFYTIDLKDTLVKYLKIVQNITLLYSLINKLKPISLKVILYGSAGKGENLKDSDLDIFTLSRNQKEVKSIFFKSPLRKHLQYIVNTPNEFARLKKKNPVFYKEISNGIVLWEQR